MNYLVAIDKFFPDRPGGSGRVAWDIAQVVRDRGHNVTMFCRKQSPDAKDISIHKRVRVVRFAFPETVSLDPFKVRKQISAGVACARKYLTDTDWDLIHIHMPLYGRIVYEVFGERPRYIYTVHSPVVMEQEVNWGAQGPAGKVKLLFGTGALKKLEGGILQKVDRIHTLSEFTKRAIDRYYGVGDKVTVIPHWCRNDFSRQYTKQQAREILGWPKNGKILFTVRVMGIRYGLDIAIRAVAPVLKKNDNVYFVLAGEGPLKESFIQLAQELSVASNIWFLGRVSDETLRRCYEAADLFVLPTLALECFGLIVLEALAYGLHLISTDAAALPELMEPILPQCIVPAGNVEKLREKIEAFLENSLCLPSGEVLEKYVKEKYSFEVVTKRLVPLLEEQQL